MGKIRVPHLRAKTSGFYWEPWCTCSSFQVCWRGFGCFTLIARAGFLLMWSNLTARLSRENCRPSAISARVRCRWRSVDQFSVR